MSYNKYRALCPTGICTGFCTTPICGVPRPGDCAQGSTVCRVAHVYPPTFQFDSLLKAWQQAADRVTASLVQQSFSERDDFVEAKEKNLGRLESSGFRPDWRFLVGFGLAGVGIYFFRKKGR